MKNKSTGGKFRIFWIIVILIFIAILTDIYNGSVTINFRDLFNTLMAGRDNNNIYSYILFEIRLPRMLTAVSAGSALALSGLIMQALFRNPLAGPYILGISSGAGLGVAMAMLGFTALGLNFARWFGNAGIILASCLGSGIFMSIIFVVSFKVRDMMTLLVVGILLGATAGALVNVLQFFASEYTLKSFVIWTMGSLSNTTWGQWYLMTAVILSGIILSLTIAKGMNVWLLGEVNARAIGVNVITVRNIAFLSSSLLAGSVTAFCGPIAFIGIAAPHISRMLIKTSDHRVLIPLSCLTGILMMLVADILSQLPGSDMILPVNTTTSLLGLPVVFWIIFKGKKMWM